jgi:hypothetical protein
VTTVESIYHRTNREHRERAQKVEAPNRRYAEVLARLLQRPQFEAVTEAPWTAPLVAFRCRACNRPMLEVRLDITPSGDPFLRASPDEIGAASDGWAGFLPPSASHGGDALVKDKPQLKCQHRSRSGVQCRYNGSHTQEKLLGLYEVAVELGKRSVRLPA